MSLPVDKYVVYHHMVTNPGLHTTTAIAAALNVSTWQITGFLQSLEQSGRIVKLSRGNRQAGAIWKLSGS